jgi:hypothetical protein
MFQKIIENVFEVFKPETKIFITKKPDIILNKIPFIIKRPLPNDKYEFVRIKDLDLSAVKYMIDL